MAGPSSTPPDGWLEIGHIRRPHGLRGDAFVQLLTDRVERLEVGSRLWSDGRAWVAVANLAVPLAAGLVGIAAGMALGARA